MHCGTHHLGSIRPKPGRRLKPQCLSLSQPRRRHVDLRKLPLRGWLPVACSYWLRLYQQPHCCRARRPWLPMSQRILTMRHGEAA